MYSTGNLKILGMILGKVDIYFLRFDNIAATKLAQKNWGQGPIQWRGKVLMLLLLYSYLLIQTAPLAFIGI